jgi:hypothetical protein
MRIKENSHYWALTKDLNPELLVVICIDADTDQGAFDVCGDWDQPMVGENLIILEEINKPKIHQHTPLYYGVNI